MLMTQTSDDRVTTPARRRSLPPLLPHDDDAKRLAASACHFGEFFTRHDISPPALGGQALLWGHCHHRATGGIDPE